MSAVLIANAAHVSIPLMAQAALEGQGVALALKPLIEADLAAGRLVIR